MGKPQESYQRRVALRELAKGKSKTQIARETGMSRTTLYRAEETGAAEIEKIKEEGHHDLAQEMLETARMSNAELQKRVPKMKDSDLIEMTSRFVQAATGGGRSDARGRNTLIIQHLQRPTNPEEEKVAVEAVAKLIEGRE